MNYKQLIQQHAAKAPAVLLAAAVTMSLGANALAQSTVTIGDLANEQVEQQKENLRVAAAKRALSSASAAKTIQDSRNQVQSMRGVPAGGQLPPAPIIEKPRWLVHSLYAQGNVWVAEMTYGNRLLTVTPGTKVGNKVATKVDARGVHFGKKVVGVGGAL